MRYLLIIIVLSLTVSCDNDTVTIKLSPDQHLENTKSGAFLKKLHINYSNSLSLTKNISQNLKKYGKLDDSYKKQDTFVYHYTVDGIKVIEHRTNTRDHLYVWFEVPLSHRSIPYHALIDEKAELLKDDREYECSVVITSKKDKARIILCGFGDYCQSITLD